MTGPSERSSSPQPVPDRLVLGTGPQHEQDGSSVSGVSAPGGHHGCFDGHDLRFYTFLLMWARVSFLASLWGRRVGPRQEKGRNVGTSSPVCNAFHTAREQAIWPGWLVKFTQLVGDSKIYILGFFLLQGAGL